MTRASVGHVPQTTDAGVGSRRDLAGAALAADLLIELDAVAAFRGVAALLSADLADLSEEFVAVASLGGETALSACLRSAHLHLFRHADLPFRPKNAFSFDLLQCFTPLVPQQHNPFLDFPGSAAGPPRGSRQTRRNPTCVGQMGASELLRYMVEVGASDLHLRA